ncbi:hypothetical protein G4Y79_20990 [Phototrophicus methaneseepsis]|uniref:Uncharacterized protein n=1 Tax=Phototrophicus methaneseepsis TaxID=2710758 RepID=A0A7S8E859_9CHLR|nr:hypothetical protein [Phototrophicus methaneseepsis]QPC82134.1 hypothetical protein G4Y79_20990 [Phototrophicus methaneseepsis]
MITFKKSFTYLLLLGLLLLMALPSVIAQEDTNTDTVPEAVEEQELPEIPFFHSASGFNVPILTTWEDQSDDVTALFVNDDLQARILVTATSEGSNAAVITTEKLGITLSDPIYSNRISTADGTWEQTYYDEGATNASLLSKVDAGQQFIIAFVEENPDAAIYMPLVDHTWEGTSALPAIDAAIESLGLADADLEPTSTDTVELNTGTWETATYEVDDTTITAYGFDFGVTDYVALAVGDASTLPELADAYNTTLLGGFFITQTNVEYLYLGIAATFGVLLLMIGSLVWRWRNARSDLKTVQQLQG